ncbi:MAG: YbaK/EbsC family protein [Peptococcaceae bacterium]|nr:YbaK/EbsC family protein [Peptococcaceae bacterium]
MNENTLRCKKYLDNFGFGERVREFEAGATATVPLAAATLGCEEAQIAKSMSFKTPEGGALIIVTAGDGKINSGMFKRQFGFKASMLKGDDVQALTGHPIGGVCPFALPEDVPVYLDVSMQRFDIIHPACGSPASMVTLTPEELAACSRTAGWVDVCKGWREEEQA